jgi:hypothetical protein
MDIDEDSLAEVIRQVYLSDTAGDVLLDCRVMNWKSTRLFSGSRNRTGVVELQMSEDGKRRTKKLWIKQSKAPELTFAELSKSYANLRKAGLDRTVPEPIGHDSVNEIVITSFVEGKSLFPIAIAAALSNPFGFNSEVSELFRKIGQWLATYHNNAQCAEKTSVASIAENCLAEINTAVKRIFT